MWEMPHSLRDLQRFRVESHGTALATRGTSLAALAGMKPLFAAVLAVHGLVHLMGPAKAFGWGNPSPLTQPVTPVIGGLWLTAALLFLATAVTFFTWPRWWWLLGALAVAASQLAVMTSWNDAKYGSLLNLLAASGVLLGFLIQGPSSLRAAFEADVDRSLTRRAPPPLVTAADLTHLPSPVRRFLELSRVVGQPRVQNVRATMHGQIRSGPDAAWMPFSAEQYNFFDRPARLFYMGASKALVPFQVFHRYLAADATMRVKIAGLLPVADASGPGMTQAETVTLLNDMCLLAPATLVDPRIVWESVDDRTARAAFTNAGYTVRADLTFNDAGELVNFVSDDRRQASPDGKTMRPLRWSTPVAGYRPFGRVWLNGRGEARWHEPAGDYAYIQIELDDVRYNVDGR